jgi:hypothetical protein
MDAIVIFLILFAAITGIFAPHFFGLGAFEFLRWAPVVGDAAPGLLDIISAVWGGFISLVAFLTFNIPGLQIVTAVYDALLAWVIIKGLVRG